MSRVVLSLVACLILVGCVAGGSSPDTDGGASGSQTAPRPAPATISGIALQPYEKVCGASPLGSRPTTMHAVAGPAGARLAVAETQPSGAASGTTVVLLHQDKPEAMCGWRDYAQHLVARGHRVIAMDLCSFGQSRCDGPWNAKYAEQVAAVVTWARETGSTRVILVGASLGGSVAVQAAPSAKADAVVDLSGPPRYKGTDIAVDAPKVTVPLLVVMSQDDRADQLDAVQVAVATSPSPQKEVRTTAGSHGWGMVVHDGAKGPELDAVTAWLEGASTAP